MEELPKHAVTVTLRGFDPLSAYDAPGWLNLSWMFFPDPWDESHLGGGFKFVFFSPLFGEDSRFD